MIPHVQLNPDLSFFENTVDLDHLAADQDPHCFPVLIQNMCIRIGEECSQQYFL